MGYAPEWRTITSWVDKEVFQDINIENEEQFQAARKISENILTAMRIWYYKHFVSVEGYLDIELSKEINSHIATGIIPLIKLTEVPEFTLFSLDSISKVNLLNDLEVRGMALLLSNELHSDNVILEYLTLSNYSTVEITKLKFTRSHNKSTEQIIGQILDAMNRRYSYPSKSEACYSCAFKKQCII
jgi:hypothetical protein